MFLALQRHLLLAGMPREVEIGGLLIQEVGLERIPSNALG